MAQEEFTIAECMQRYLHMIRQARAANTFRTYSNAMDLFSKTLEEHGTDPIKTKICLMSEEPVIWVVTDLKTLSPASEQVYITGIVGFYEFIAGENLAEINLPRIRLLIKQRARRPGVRLPQFPKSDIEKVLEYASTLGQEACEDKTNQLIQLRDKAFLLCLADTGLRVHEACALRCGDIDWASSRAIIIGKGNKEAVIRFSQRSISAITDYLAQRKAQSESSGKVISAQAVFARHDKACGKKILPISTTTGREIVNHRVQECLGDEKAGTITPHSFRHYFVTIILGKSGNLKLAQELARHTNISVTQRYSHLAKDELDQKYNDIFD